MSFPNWITVRGMRVLFSEERFRVPLVFGSGAITTITKATVLARVETVSGRQAVGCGQILLSDLWAFPEASLPHETKDALMRTLVDRYAKLLLNAPPAHPVDLFMDSKPRLKELCRELAREAGLNQDIPLLAGLVCASPADMALHDAMGRAMGVSSYALYGQDAMHDLSAWLGGGFRGRYVADFLKPSYDETIPVFHLVGGGDKLYRSEVTATDPNDGLPVSLEDWIASDSLDSFKIKLKGVNVDDDVKRTVAVANCIEKTRGRLGLAGRYYLTIDQNEMCESPDVDIEYLRTLREAHPRALEALLYIEQPTSRDLSKHRMHDLAKLKPVLVDEGMLDLDSMQTALERGWSGFALKVCKGLSSALIYVARAEASGLPYSVQDLTNPGVSLFASAGFAAHVRPIRGVESNVRQFIPAGNRVEERVHPHYFRRADGVLPTGISNRYPGLGFDLGAMPEYLHEL